MDQANKLREAVKEMNISKDFSARVIAITSGKGGVGKSNITLNLGIELSRRGKKVVILDADFGLANIEILAGIVPKYSFADVLKGRQTVTETITQGPENVDFISGGSGIVDFIRSGDAKIGFIMDNFSILDKMYDIILIDTGAGVSDNVLNFIRASSEAIVVTTPEPTSLTDAYALLKSVKSVCSEEDMPKFNIIVNRIEDSKEGHEVFNKLLNVSNNFLKIDLELLGFIPVDYSLVKAIKKQQAVLLYSPKGTFTKAIETICESLLSQKIVIQETTGIAQFMRRLANIFNS